MKKTVAIVGSHPGTREDFDFDRTDCDIWVFNEALNTPWCKRATGVFQLHQPIIWRSATNRNDPKHYEWLKSGDTPTIFMIDQYEDVPQSERYPLDEIMETFDKAEKYFTSSVSFAIALAIYKGYERIEVYGVEMETSTEYGHQRVGVAYWCGFAAGMGIEVDYHSPTFFKAPLYGYDGDIKIPMSRFEDRIETLRPHKIGTQDAFNNVNGKINFLLQEFIKTYKADLTELDEFIMALGQNSQNYGMIDGAIQTNEHYLEKCQQMQEESGDHLIVRQEFEGQYLGAMKKIREETKRVYSVSNELGKKRDALNTNDNKDKRKVLVDDFKAWLQNYVNAVTDLGRANGIMNENRMILTEFDSILRAAGVEPEKVEVPEEAQVPA